MKTHVQKWGNSLALRIPKSFANEIGLQGVLQVYLLTMIITGMVVITGCATEPVNTTTAVTATPMQTETMPPDTIAATVTETATPTTTTQIVTTTRTTNYLPANCLVLDLILPEGGVVKNNTVFSFSIVVTNTGLQLLTWRVPITFTNTAGPTNTITYYISVELFPGDGNKFSFFEAILPMGSYIVQVGDVIKTLTVD